MVKKIIKIIAALVFLCLATLVLILRPTYKTELGYQSQKILISRDQYNIPSIHAPSRKSFFYAMGYAQSEDRLFQIQFKRLAMQGRLSQFFGQKALDLDKLFRELNLKQWGNKNAQRLRKENIKAYQQFQAYADGVNDHAQSLVLLPMDFYLSGLKWSNWTVSSTFGMKKIFQWFQTFSAFDEFARSHLLSKYSKQECQAFFPQNDKVWAFDSVPVIKDEDIPEHLSTKYLKKNKKQKIFTPQIIQQITNLGIFEFIKTTQGSNSWVISGEHTKSGKPILANDPHLQSVYPSPWYQMYGHYVHNGKQFSVSGIAPTGIPLIIGKTEYMAIGVTTVFTDTQDLFRQKINNNEQYLLDGKWRSLKKRTQVIKIKGKTEERYTVYQTHRGPIIHYLFAKIGSYFFEQGLSIQWSGFNDEYNSLVQLSRYAQINDIETLKNTFLTKAGDFMNVNVLFGTADGHIGYQQMGSYPIRRNQGSGNFIKDGTTTKDDWFQILSMSEHLQVIDPQCGYIVSANNKIASSKYYNGIHDYQIYTARADRITQMIQYNIRVGKKFNVNDVKQMLLDTIDVYCRQILPYIITAIPEAQPQFINFDCNFSSTSYQATMYQVFLFEFHHLTKPHKTENMSIMAFHQNQQRLYNQIKSNKKNNLLKKAWTQMIANLTASFKTQTKSQWKWGIYHQDAMHHLPFGATPLKSLYDRTFQGSGNINTVNVGKMNKVQFGNFQVSHRATYRGVYSLSQKEDSWFIIDTGSSQHAFSRHYDDQWKLFSKNQMIKMSPAKNINQEL